MENITFENSESRRFVSMHAQYTEERNCFRNHPNEYTMHNHTIESVKVASIVMSTTAQRLLLFFAYTVHPSIFIYSDTACQSQRPGKI